MIEYVKRLFEKDIPIPESLRAFADEAIASDQAFYNLDLSKFTSTQVILESKDQQRAALLVDCVILLQHIQQEFSRHNSFTTSDPNLRLHYASRELFSSLARGHHDYSEPQVILLLEFAARQRSWATVSNASIVGIVERFCKNNIASDDLKNAINALVQSMVRGNPNADGRKLIGRLQALGSTDKRSPPILNVEPWADDAIRFLEALPEPQRDAWLDLICSAKTASGSSPSKKYLGNSKKLIEAVGTEAFSTIFQKWIEIAGTKATLCQNPMGGGGDVEAGINTDNADVLKGMVWAAASLDDPNWAPPLGDLAERCYKKLPWVGPRCAKVANACVAGLSIMTGEAPAAQLARLKQKVKQPTGRRMTEKAIGRFADRSGLTIDEVEEQSVPSFGLSRDGIRSDVFGKYVAHTRIIDGREIDVNWTGPDGKSRKAAPVSIKSEHAAQLKEFKAIHKQLDSQLTAQRFRIEELFIFNRTWTLSNWKKYYLDHPLVAQIAKKLIWIVSETPIVYSDHDLLDVHGSIYRANDDEKVTLWHPALRSADEVLAWRNRLAALRITQPFKQTHREVYLLTEAERRTETYSNRFAAHILRQHQFAALCQQRGWKYKLQGNFDGGGGHPERELKQWNLRVEFWVDPVNEAQDYLTGSGIFLYIVTDQLRFYQAGTTEPMPVAQVPPIVFTEILRDVDLFVGVGSVGNDPTWQDGGPQGRFVDYWNGYSFGDLTESAKTRRVVLESVLPKLTKLKGLWSLTEKFLVIKGKKHTYKIHLGSGNILMEPNDQYLCIVPDRSNYTKSPGDIFLPFEGDATLSIILSKAFLLAADDQIKDPTITRQIG